MHHKIHQAKVIALQAGDVIRRQADRGARELGGRLSANLTRQLARVAHRAGDYLETTDTRQMVDDARRFARKQPWAVVAIGVVTGFALSRVVNHAPQRRRSWDG